MDIFLITAPGQQDFLAAEAREKGFKVTEIIPGGVTIRGGWPDVWRANLQLRGASRILARLGQFRATNLSQLEKLAREFPWSDTLRPGETASVTTTSRKSKIYHAGAATERFENALTAQGFVISDTPDHDIRIRIEKNIVTISLDTSDDSLHKRGHKEAVNAAPMRETMAAMFLREARYNGKEPLYDPMCGSGTFVLEAAEIALRLDPGRARTFAFQSLPNFDAAVFRSMISPSRDAAYPVFGSDRDEGAIRMATANAERAKVDNIAAFRHLAISDATPPIDAPGLVICNPPYGTRIGNKKPLFALYGSFGARMKSHFKGWRVAFVTSDAALAKATGLPVTPGPVVAHGGLRVRLWQTGPLD
ncbi:MAG: class I SAM-dependent RNA methyltransferase [Pseudomonadota bacterium]